MNSASSPREPVNSRPLQLFELARVFVHLGFTAFGSPAAQIARIERELVVRRHWLAAEELVGLAGASSVAKRRSMRSPTALVIEVGRRRAGLAGLVVAGLCFVLPGALMTAALAGWYVAVARSLTVSGVLRAVKPVVVVILLQALWNLARGSGQKKRAPPLGTLAAATALFAGGVALLAFVHADLVVRAHALSDAQMLDAIASGQLTPGPAFTAVTFVGYLLGGAPGAAVASAGVFLAGFVPIAARGHVSRWMRRSKVASSFLEAGTLAVVALVAVVAIYLARAAIVDGITLGLAAVSAVLLFHFRAPPPWVIVGAAALGALALGSIFP